MKQISFTLALAAIAVFFTNCNKKMNTVNSGIKISYMDTSVAPGDDFNEYANGNWIKNNPVPSTENRWGSFNEIEDRNLEKLKSIVNEASSDHNAAKGSDRQLVGDFYRTALDSNLADKNGIKPLLTLQKEIEAIKNNDDLIKILAKFQKKSITGFFSFYVGSDLKNSMQNISYLSQSGFNLPDRDYYFLAEYESIRDEYNKHISKTLEMLFKYNNAIRYKGENIYFMEKRLASKAMNSLEMRNIEAQYNLMTYDELKKKYSNINWDLFFEELGSVKVDKVVVEHINFMNELNDILKNTTIENLKGFLQWQLINSTATYLSSDFDKQNFYFYETILKGTKEIKPRWKRAIDYTDNCLGEPLGKLFVEKYFNKEAKEKINILVDNLTATYRERITNLSWMSDSTKQQALVKLDKIIRKLGYPDKWKDYSKLKITTESFCLNVLNCEEFNYKLMLSKIGKPVDRTEWGMSTPTVNAYYNPSINEIVFPAGIMQPPFFDPNADDAANYGGIGAIIGHELTHGFDDQGSQFDADGNLKNWWKPKDKELFEKKTELLEKQFSNYVAIDTLRVNGKLTLGENIADLGGLTLGYYAYKKSLKGKPSPVIEGLTGEQRFFISWAQGWKNNIKPEALKQRLATDPHSPAKFRVNGPMSNMQEFYDAFDIKPNSKMYLKPENRSLIW
ncbi:MAG: M13 family metallopeptidase [Bacteroidetes bacterium]|nr:M13 family metallopeptidase [Bacteroidota bacterium]